MIKFLLKGILNDRSRSVLPIIIVSVGAMLTVFLSGWLKGIIGESIVMSANIQTGHVKIVTRAYAQEMDQNPNDLALLETSQLLENLKTNFPEAQWVQRIRFGGLIDFPDTLGETKSQGPAVGFAMDLLSAGSKEAERFNLEKSLVEGRLPQKPGEALLSADFAAQLKASVGETFTLFGTTMDGGMAFYNFQLCGTLRFGTPMLDKGAAIVDLADAQAALGMYDAAGEILGFLDAHQYDQDKATALMKKFNASYEGDPDPYAPTMMTIREQEGMAELLDYSNLMGGIFVFIFVLAMSVVLWNTGLLGGLRRYKEFGIRLALGEEKSHIYKTLIYEALLIGVIGSVLGTIMGLGITYYIYVVGIDISGMMENASMMFPSVIRTAITPESFYIGFIPGLFSMVLGNALSGIGIYKRQTATLFKELEV